MIIESVAAASAILSSINGLIKQANETGAGLSQVMGTISEFGEALTEFEMDRKASTFRPLSQGDMLKLSQLRKQQERYWKSINDLLVVHDPALLEDFNKMKREQEQMRKDHTAMLAKKKKEKDKIISQLLVGGTTFLIGGGIAAGFLYLTIKAFT
jgi:adenylosuccinate synthase